MDFYESDLEDIIWDCFKTPEGVDKLCEKGLHLIKPSRSFRQLRLGNYGIADLVTFDKSHYKIQDEIVAEVTITIYELKKDQIKLDSLVQLCRYMKGVKRYFGARGCQLKYSDIRGVLIGKSLNVDDWVYLTDHIQEKIDFYTYEYSIDGMSFEHKNCDFHLIEEGFKL